jgi:hypothetical protein
MLEGTWELLLGRNELAIPIPKLLFPSRLKPLNNGKSKLALWVIF